MTSTGWEALVPYDAWAATCDTLHAHSQLLGKLAVALAPPEPQLQHAALRLTARGWETMPLPAPDGSGALVVTLDLHRHETVMEHSDGRTERVPLTPSRSVGEVSRDVLAGMGRLGGPVEINPNPQEVSWSAPLNEDEEHRTYEPGAVATYFAAATRAALVLADLRALPGTELSGQRVVGHVRPGREPVFGSPGRAAFSGLHHAQCRRRPADRDWLVGRRCPPSRAGFLRVCRAGTGRVCQRGPRTGGGWVE